MMCTCARATDSSLEATLYHLSCHMSKMESVGDRECVENWHEARDTLRSWREEGVRKSSQTVQLAQFLLKDKPSSLGSEVWDVQEQLFVAALDTGDIELGQRSLEVLVKQFPGSLRVQRLQGMLLEADERYDEALTLYDEALQNHPNNAALWKRKIAVLKVQSSTTDAIKELTAFLGVFMGDKEGWLELTDLYIQVNNYSKAAFCMEELILLNPHHHLYHQRYAEVCYSLGTSDRIESARKHFATALQLNPDNVRALYGFCWACHMPNSQKKSDVKTRNTRYIEWAKTQLKLKYQNGNGQLRIVEKMLDSVR